MFGNDDSTILGIDRRTALKAIGAMGIAGAFSGGTASAQVSDPEAPAEPAAPGRGPLQQTRFLVEIDGIATAGFQRVNLPEASVSQVSYRDGNDPTTNRKLAGNRQYETLVLERGVEAGVTELYEWYKQVEEGKTAEAARAIAVILLDRQGNAQARWEFTDAWPARYEGPELDAMTDGVATETLEIVFDEMERTQ